MGHLLEFRLDDGYEVLERLRQKVNLWPQTMLSFVSADGRSLLVLIPYRLTGGGVPVTESQVALFQQYAYKRAADFAVGSLLCSGKNRRGAVAKQGRYLL